jgi:hypothetical protein
MTEVSFTAVSFTLVLSLGGFVPLALSLQPIAEAKINSKSKNFMLLYLIW